MRKRSFLLFAVVITDCSTGERNRRIIIIFSDECIIEGWTKYDLSKRGKEKRLQGLHRGGDTWVWKKEQEGVRQCENVLMSFRVALSCPWASDQPRGLLSLCRKSLEPIGNWKVLGKCELVFFWCWLGLLFFVVGTWSNKILGQTVVLSLFEVWVLIIDVFQLSRRRFLPFWELPEWICKNCSGSLRPVIPSRGVFRTYPV